MTAQRKATCPACDTLTGVRKDGTFRHHPNNAIQACPGSRSEALGVPEEPIAPALTPEPLDFWLADLANKRAVRDRHALPDGGCGCFLCGVRVNVDNPSSSRFGWWVHVDLTLPPSVDNVRLFCEAHRRFIDPGPAWSVDEVARARSLIQMARESLASRTEQGSAA